MENKMEKIVSLAKRRGFIFPGSEIYGGLSGFWDLGPYGAELAHNIKELWWEHFVKSREDMYGIATTAIMSEAVWRASGHLEGFSDPMVECKKCHDRVRADEVNFPSTKERMSDTFTPLKCKKCGALDWKVPKQFNLMFKTHVGPSEDSSSEVYLRPEIALVLS